MKNRILHLTRNTIPYVKELHSIAGGVLGCLVMQQLDYWFESHPQGFYKFLEPSDHPAYKDGDSWTEELGMSRHEFRTAFDKIGIRYKSKSDFDKAVDKFQGLFYCSYVDRRSNLTYYFRNHDLLDAALKELLTNPAQQPSKQRSPLAGNPHQEAKFSVKPESGFTGNTECGFTVNEDSGFTGGQDSSFTGNPEHLSPLYRDYNTETTTTTEHSNAMESEGCCGDLIFPICTPEESIAIGQLLATCPADLRQKVLDEIEGARQAGVIKTNLVPFARGIVSAITKGSFTVGHGAKVNAQRQRQAKRVTNQIAVDLALDPNFIDKGKAFLRRIDRF